MFEMLDAAAQAWREVLHVSEWTGLSVGALAGLAALAWFWSPARSLAITTGIAVAACYGGLIWGNHVGTQDVLAEWSAANAAAAKEAGNADTAAQASLDTKYGPIIAALQKQNDDLQSQVHDYESKIVGQLGVCALGADALKLRGPAKR